MGEKRVEKLEKDVLVQNKDMQRVGEKIDEFNNRLLIVEQKLDNQQNKKWNRIFAIILSMFGVGVLSVVFWAGAFVQKVNNCIDDVDTLTKSFTQMQLANGIVCVQLPKDKGFSMKKMSDTGDKILSPLNWEKDTVIDEKGQIEARDLIGKQMIATYEVGEIHTVFYGSYNNLLHWQGSCLLNSYNKDNELVFVMEALYEDGELLCYKQLSMETGKEPYWLVTKRMVSEDGNQGESWTYYKKEDIKQEFDWDIVSQKDILTMDTVAEKLQGTIRSYYTGTTTEGVYNDDTGNARLVLFDEQEKVNVFYQGKFVNGTMEDDTGEAWEIARDSQKGIGYIYQKGIFRGGKCVKSTEPVDTDLSLNKILSYLKKYGIENIWRWEVD